MRQKTGKVPQSFSVLTAAYLAILLSIYLLYPGRGGYQTITAQKWSAYLLITGVYIAAMLLLHLELAIVGAARLPAPTMLRKTLGLPQKFILLYLFATVLSTLFSEFRQTALWGGGRCEGLAAIALYCLSFPPRVRLRTAEALDAVAVCRRAQRQLCDLSCPVCGAEPASPLPGGHELLRREYAIRRRVSRHGRQCGHPLGSFEPFDPGILGGDPAHEGVQGTLFPADPAGALSGRPAARVCGRRHPGRHGRGRSLRPADDG